MSDKIEAVEKMFEEELFTASKITDLMEKNNIPPNKLFKALPFLLAGLFVENNTDVGEGLELLVQGTLLATKYFKKKKEMAEK